MKANEARKLMEEARQQTIKAHMEVLHLDVVRDTYNAEIAQLAKSFKENLHVEWQPKGEFFTVTLNSSRGGYLMVNQGTWEALKQWLIEDGYQVTSKINHEIVISWKLLEDIECE